MASLAPGHTTLMDDAQTCTQCRISKPLSAFWKDSRRKSGYHPWCKECKRQYRVRNKRFANRVKSRLGCHDCGNKDYRVLDFDHLDGKIADISWAAHNSWSISRLKTEMRKCVVRCANCHRIKTYNDQT